MTGITDPAQEYFKDGLWAWVTDQWKKLVADASQFLQINIAAQDIDVEVKQTTAADLTPGVMGWDGSAWRKLPLVWGYSDRYGETVSDLTPSGGSVELATSAVPAGEVWIAENVAAIDSTTALTRIRLRAIVNSVAITLVEILTPGAGVMVVWGGRVTLAEGDYLRADFTGVTAGDDLYVTACGYKMKIAE